MFVGKVSVEKALERFINGKSLSGDPVRYIEALHLIVHHTGKALDNRAVAPAAPKHFSYIDDALKRSGLGADISMSALIFGGAPLTCPHGMTSHKSPHDSRSGEEGEGPDRGVICVYG